jgi:hypothetical protein
MRILLALLFALGLSTLVGAQAPPPVPALPDAPRLTTYSLSGSTCACAVGFQIYGDGTDVDAWLQVFIGSIPYQSTDPAHGWAITSPTGPLGSIARPITNAILTFALPQTGAVTIVGDRRPRRTSQFPENAGVSARSFNQVLTDIIATQREMWDKLNSFTGGSAGSLLGTPLPGYVPVGNGAVGIWSGSYFPGLTTNVERPGVLGDRTAGLDLPSCTGGSNCGWAIFQQPTSTGGAVIPGLNIQRNANYTGEATLWLLAL